MVKAIFTTQEDDQKIFGAVCEHLRKSLDKPMMDDRECLNLALTYYIEGHGIKVDLGAS